MELQVKKVDKPTYRILRTVKRFNQKYTVFSRMVWDPFIQRLRRLYHRRKRERIAKGEQGYSFQDYALQKASWYVATALGTFTGLMHGNAGLYSWESLEAPKEVSTAMCIENIETTDPATMSDKIKKVAEFFGADLIGICKLNKLWVYSHSYNRLTGENKPIKISKSFNYAIAVAIEMDYDTFMATPTALGAAATGLGYSQMAFVSSLLSEFIRKLGYHAIPCGNDTALSIPIAIDAGLGELGRNGLLITPEFGSRVRLCKVFTDLPLKPDNPVDFGVQKFCEKCNKCAAYCPAHAISNEERTAEAISVSNNSGVLKWPVDAEKCYRFWCENGADCGICIKVCPFNR